MFQLMAFFLSGRLARSTVCVRFCFMNENHRAVNYGSRCHYHGY